MEKESRPNWLRRLVLVLVLLAAVFVLYVIRNTLIPLFLSMLIAYLLTPLADFLENRGLGRILAISFTFVLFFALLFLIALYLIPLINNELKGFTAGMPRYLGTVNEEIVRIQERIASTLPAVRDVDIGGRIQKVIIEKLQTLPTFVINIFSVFPLLILVPLISFFFLKDGKRIKRGFVNSLPNRYFEMVYGLLYEIDRKIGSYVRGQLLRSTIIGCLTFLGLKLFGLKYSLLLGIFAGVMNLVPYAGPLIGSIPAVVLAALNQAGDQVLLSQLSPLPLVVHIILVYVVVQMLDAVWIAPYILGWSVDIHPLGIVLLLLFGNQLFGWWGIILAVPVASIFQLILQAVYSHYRVYRA